MVARPTISALLSLPIVALAAVILPRTDPSPVDRSLVADIAEGSPKPPPDPTPSVAWDEPAPGPPESIGPPASGPLLPVAFRDSPAFTRVREGETFADVAARVYGTAADPRSLWEANRDQFAGIDSVPPTGMLLRTPDPK